MVLAAVKKKFLTVWGSTSCSSSSRGNKKVLGKAAKSSYFFQRESSPGWRTNEANIVQETAKKDSHILEIMSENETIRYGFVSGVHRTS